MKRWVKSPKQRNFQTVLYFITSWCLRYIPWLVHETVKVHVNKHSVKDCKLTEAVATLWTELVVQNRWLTNILALLECQLECWFHRSVTACESKVIYGQRCLTHVQTGSSNSRWEFTLNN